MLQPRLGAAPQLIGADSSFCSRCTINVLLVLEFALYSQPQRALVHISSEEIELNLINRILRQ